MYPSSTFSKKSTNSVSSFMTELCQRLVYNTQHKKHELCATIIDRSLPTTRVLHSAQKARTLCHHSRPLCTGLVVILRVTSAWQNVLRGLCGTHDGNSMNDLMMRDGSIASSPTEFGNSWKEAGVTCSDIPEAEILPDPCAVCLYNILLWLWLLLFALRCPDEYSCIRCDCTLTNVFNRVRGLCVRLYFIT